MDKPLFINSKEEYENKLKEVERLVALDPETGSINGIRLNFLASQVEMYEKLYFDLGAKLAKARKIREDIWEFLLDNTVATTANTRTIYSYDKALKRKLTMIAKKHL